MATRSRTLLFVQCRQSYPRRQWSSSSSSSRRPLPAGAGAAHPSGLMLLQPGESEASSSAEKFSLLQHKNDGGGGGGSYAAAAAGFGTLDEAGGIVSTSAMPPPWVDNVADVDSTLERIQTQLMYLDTLHKRNLLPGFSDRSAEVAGIENTTAEISSMFRHCQDLLNDFQAHARMIPSGRLQELQVHRNVAVALATKISMRSTEFRKAQSNYLAHLKSRAYGNAASLMPKKGNGGLIKNGLNSSTGAFKTSGDSNAYGGTGMNDDDKDYDDFEDEGVVGPLMFSDNQRQQIDAQERLISQRDREINDIARTIQDVGEMFQEINKLVIDQGTLFDRIDYNMEQAAVNVCEGNQELTKASDYQKSSIKRKVILLLILVICLLVMVALFKYLRSSSSSSASPQQPQQPQDSQPQVSPSPPASQKLAHNNQDQDAQPLQDADALGRLTPAVENRNFYKNHKSRRHKRNLNNNAIAHSGRHDTYQSNEKQKIKNWAYGRPHQGRKKFPDFAEDNELE